MSEDMIVKIESNLLDRIIRKDRIKKKREEIEYLRFSNLMNSTDNTETKIKLINLCESGYSFKHWKLT